MRDPSEHRSKHLGLCDNLGDVLDLARCRASDYSLLQLRRRFGALCLATEAIVALRWVASELDPADEPSRRYDHHAIEQESLYAQSPTSQAGPGTTASAVAVLKSSQRVWQNEAAQLLLGLKSKGNRHGPASSAPTRRSKKFAARDALYDAQTTVRRC